ncbi:MAG: STAS/SEC14 domain-containing protein [Chloroflexi bacterium]|nr:STAS/SEC14 domain-containing protein [Chloroflexota bacterium]
MTPNEKPLDWSSEPERGYRVARRPDGGLHVTFHHLSPAVLAHWQAFAQRHLQGAERFNRNLYDLRAVAVIPPDAIQLAEDVNADPAARFVRVAVVVSSKAVQQALAGLAQLSSGVEMEVFSNLEEAERWLDRPASRLLRDEA